MLGYPLIRPSNYVIQLTHTFSPTIVNDLRGGINRSALHHYQNGTCPLSTANGLSGTACASVPPFDSPSDSQLDEEIGTTIDGYICDLHHSMFPKPHSSPVRQPAEVCLAMRRVPTLFPTAKKRRTDGRCRCTAGARSGESFHLRRPRTAHYREPRRLRDRSP